MAKSDAEKWDRRYRARTEPNPPAQVLIDNLHLLPNQGQALELAAGLGGNSLLLAGSGLHVDALDVSSVAMNRLQQQADTQQLSIQTAVADLEQWTPNAARYDVVIVSSFYLPTLFNKIRHCLKHGGLVFYQTFTQLKVIEKGPSNPDFLLSDGELLRQFADYRLLNYREDRDLGNLQQGLRNQAYLVAQKP